MRQLLAVFLFAISAAALAADEAPVPIKALYITGGGYHDYKKLTPLLTENIAKFGNIKFDVKEGIDIMKDPKLGEGYDVIVYNMCYQTDKTKDDDLVKNAMRVTNEGKPTVLVHCAMHCFRIGDEWAQCCGMKTKAHDSFRAFATTKAKPEHAIIKEFPEDFKTSGDELYQNIVFPEDSTPLLLAHSVQSNKDHVVAWVHTYGKGKVFGTTLGHDMKTAAQVDYHHLLANGILWVCGKLGDDGKPAKGYGGTETK